MCAKNHLLVFSSFLDIWENVEWPRFLDHPVQHIMKHGSWNEKTRQTEDNLAQQHDVMDRTWTETTASQDQRQTSTMESDRSQCCQGQPERKILIHSNFARYHGNNGFEARSYDFYSHFVAQLCITQRRKLWCRQYTRMHDARCV